MSGVGALISHRTGSHAVSRPVTHQPPDDDACRSGGDHHDPDWSLDVADGIADSDLVCVVHRDQDQGHDDCSYEQPAEYDGEIVSMNCTGMLGDVSAHCGYLRVDTSRLWYPASTRLNRTIADTWTDRPI